MVKFHNATIFSDIWPWYISVKRLPNRFLRTDQNVRIDNKNNQTTAITQNIPSHEGLVIHRAGKSGEQGSQLQVTRLFFLNHEPIPPLILVSSL